MSDNQHSQSRDLDVTLAQKGLRLTPQRQDVYSVLLQDRDHPTAEQVFIRAKKIRPEISMATVYNCLDALVKCGLVREVNLDRHATRYCPNMEDHSHFYCDACGQIFDIQHGARKRSFEVPKGFAVSSLNLSLRGLCPACAGKAN